jgi:choline kinase
LLHNVTLPIALPTLTAAFHSMLASEKLQGLASDADNLLVRIVSFSFHRGLPKDESGNGGGFVFDGRSLPNPGREDRFKLLTGRDAPVIDYLNQEESVHHYLASVMSLVNASVQNYQSRRFRNLMVSCGCTGGQHRSVYLAEQVTKRLRGRSGVEVVLQHRDIPMRAMILAAGLGKRLRPLTDDRPKALVEVNGQTLLEIALSRLRQFCIREVIVNVHHFDDMVVEYLKKNNNFGMRIEVSREDVLLDTGGGLKKAAWFFLEEGRADEPFLLHNVDVLSTIDFRRMAEFHKQNQALATLAVQDRQTSRYLLFDEQHQLCGRRTGGVQEQEIVRMSKEIQALAFSGVHIISPRILPMIAQNGAFSIIDSYLRLAGQGEKIQAFRADEFYWRDLGKPENVEQAAQDLKQQILQV